MVKSLYRVLTLITALFFSVYGIGYPPQSAAAASWACEQYDTKIRVSLGQGDTGAAMAAQQALRACQTSGAGAAVATNLGGCATYDTLASQANARGDIGGVAVWSAAARDCRTNTSAYLASLKSGGGQSGGSGGGTVQKPPTEVAPSCQSAPNDPSLKITQLVSGVRFEVTPAATGERHTDLRYEYNFFSETTKAWGTWTGFISMGTGAFSKTFTPPTPDIKRVAFAVYATNSCGPSKIVRESPTNVGVKIINPAVNQVIFDQGTPTSIKLNSSPIDLSGLVKASNFGTVSLTSSTPHVCSVDGNSVTPIRAGDCYVVGATQGTEEFEAGMTGIWITVLPVMKKIVCLKKTNKSVKKTVTAVNPKCPAGYVKS